MSLLFLILELLTPESTVNRPRSHDSCYGGTPKSYDSGAGILVRAGAPPQQPFRLNRDQRTEKQRSRTTDTRDAGNQRYPKTNAVETTPRMVGVASCGSAEGRVVAHRGFYSRHAFALSFDMILAWQRRHTGSTHLPRSGRRYPLPRGGVMVDQRRRGRW